MRNVIDLNDRLKREKYHFVRDGSKFNGYPGEHNEMEGEEIFSRK